MSVNWSSDRLKRASIGVRENKYEAIPTSPQEMQAKETYPQLFEFNAVSVGDENGQAFLVPLDESSKETAEYILRAIATYDAKLAERSSERAEAVAVLREACDLLGDNDWDDALHLADVIEKHLLKHLLRKVDDEN